MSINIKKLRGMSEALAASLIEKGIRTSDQLLAAAQDSKARQELAKTLQTDVKSILELANRADLARIKGIGSVYSDLLEQAGVDTVRELATRNAANLLQKIGEINAAQNLAGRLPTLKQVQDWVEQAKSLPRKIEH
ncbi:MAG: DUF4332 domain-containing protein [Candidatus Promineifilaceae bacterium]